MGVAHFVLQQFEETIACSRRALLHNPRFVPALRYQAASLALLGQIDKASAVTAGHASDRAAADALDAAGAQHVFMTESVWQRYAEGLRLAGLPE